MEKVYLESPRVFSRRSDQ